MDATILSPSINISNVRIGGVYSCARCGYALFANEDKIQSNKNILFSRPLSDKVLQVEENYTYGLPRSRVSCAKCGLHAGYIYNDAKSKTQKRYTIVGAAVTWGEYNEDEDDYEESDASENLEEDSIDAEEIIEEEVAQSGWRKGIQWLAVFAAPVVFRFLAKKYT